MERCIAVFGICVMLLSAGTVKAQNAKSVSDKEISELLDHKNNIVKRLLAEYNGITDPDNHEKEINEVISKLIEIEATQVIALCVKHIDNPYATNRFNIIVQKGSTASNYVNYLIGKSEHSVPFILEYIACTPMSESNYDLYINHAAVIVAHSNLCNKIRINKMCDYLLEKHNTQALQRIRERGH